MKTIASTVAAGTVLAFAFAGSLVASAQPTGLSPMHFKVVGGSSLNIPYREGDLPMWTDVLPKESGGAITGDIVPYDQVGIDDKALLRLLSRGVMDIVTMGIGIIAGDSPVFEGCDLAGMSLSIEQARAACAAWRPAMDRLMQEKWKSKLLTIEPQVPQIFWCRTPIGGLADLSGKKIRVANRTQSDFVEANNATAVNIPFAELVPALQRGVVDCIVTGSLSGNTLGLPEVSTHIFPMYLGWSINVHAINLDRWNSLSPEMQAFLEKEFSALEDRLWKLGAESVIDGENCNLGKDPCKLGKKANLTLVPVRADEMGLHKKIMETVVLRNWAQRCGAACTEEWNNTVGKALDLHAPEPAK
jgi:TRAP-type C4-dicarboxylate transport system substrate-binding protein